MGGKVIEKAGAGGNGNALIDCGKQGEELRCANLIAAQGFVCLGNELFRSKLATPDALASAPY